MTSTVGMTPEWVQRQLYQLYVDLPVAQHHLAQARDAEVDAKHAYESARRRVILSPQSPKVTRGGYTTADRDAYVETEVAGLRFAYDKATVIAQTAQDHLRTLRDQAEIVRSLGVSVRLDYEMAALGQPG